ncbi:hypothetical protein V6U90_24540 [Micromonospora sp. CPCC 206060]|uniref:hypothetical protein n=1 Tax=Micromonospora sp. CPCC 206060 TaxID=3122406 RepID=UPI002FEEAC47
MLQAFSADPPCAMCGQTASHVELVPPHAKPVTWQHWSPQERRTFEAARQRRGPQQWWLLYSGIERGNGSGDPVDEARALRIVAAFTEPYCYSAVTTAGFYDDAGFCGQCDAPYCHRHWNVSSSGYGTCPRGHGKSLDPHWWPEDL